MMMGSVRGLMLLVRLGVSALVWLPIAGPAMAAAITPVPAEHQKMAIDALASQLVFPDTAIWSFDGERPFVGRTLVCGKVVYENSVRRIVAPQQFYIMISGTSVTSKALQPLHPMQDPTGKLQAMITLLCGPP